MRSPKLTGGKISNATAYRLVKLRGELKTFDAQLLEAMCDALDVEPGELIEQTGPGISLPVQDKRWRPLEQPKGDERAKGRFTPTTEPVAQG